MKNPMKISVLICTRNRPQDIVLVLPTVLNNDYPNYEVIIVDQSDNKETAGIVCSYLDRYLNLRYVATETRGLSAARNLAVSLADGEVIAFTDDDCETPSDWVAAIAEAFGQTPELGLVFGQVHMLPEHQNKDVAVPCLYFEDRHILKRGEVFGMGANMAFRRSVWDQVGIYDTVLGAGGFFPGGEDFDFSYRAQRLGVLVVAEPSIMLVHRAFRAPDRWHEVMNSYGIGDAAFYAKHARCGDSWAFRAILSSFVRSGIRAAAKTLLRREPNNDRAYLNGFLKGLRQSVVIPVHKSTHLYQRLEGWKG